MTRVRSSFLILILLLMALSLLEFPSKAQGGIQLRQPFHGYYRITAYVDHDRPLIKDGYMYAFTGQKVLNCPAANSNLGSQGSYCYDGHEGTDYAHCNAEVLAAAPGYVSDSGWKNDYLGYTITIDHGNGYDTRYAHLKGGTLISAGKTVLEGEVIGISGSSGYVDGPGKSIPQSCHLHFEVRKDTVYSYSEYSVLFRAVYAGVSRKG